MNILEDLQKRKILKAITNENKFRKLKQGVGVYIGFDPTAPSLHLGNYIQIALLLRMKRAGFRAVAVLGSATGGIGDPSGKQNERAMLSLKVVRENSKAIQKQLREFGLEVINNEDFYENMLFINFLREIGKRVNVNYMLSKEVVSNRLEAGISFAEFSYQLLQGYDFYQLYKKHNIQIQMGGSDQWGNITTGIEIIRKMIGKDNSAIGIITHLMTTSGGKKIGKTVEGAIWINRHLTSPYTLYQHLLNTNDNDLEHLFNWLTFLSLSQIQEIIAKHDTNRANKYGQKELAKTVVIDIHSRKDYTDAVAITNLLFTTKPGFELLPSHIKLLKTALPTTSFGGENIQDFLVNNKILASRRLAREAIANKLIMINGRLITNNDLHFDKTFAKKAKLVRKGKKHFYLVTSD